MYRLTVTVTEHRHAYDCVALLQESTAGNDWVDVMDTGHSWHHPVGAENADNFWRILAALYAYSIYLARGRRARLPKIHLPED